MHRVEIIIKGRLDPNWSEWFGGLTIRYTEQSETILSGKVVDQAALYGLLTKLQNLGLPLVSVNCAETEPGRPATSADDSAAR